MHGKGGTTRTVPLPQVLIEPLYQYISTRQPGNPDEKKVFLNRWGKGFKESVYNQIINYYLRKARALAGITDVASGSHTFRHTFITGQERNNRELADIMKVVGIINLNNLQIYLDLERQEVLREFRQKFNLGGYKNT